MEDRIVSKLEDDEDEFRSCCGNEEELEEIVKLGLKNGDCDCDFDEFTVRMLFKGVSISGVGKNVLGVSGIGVIMEGSDKVPVIQVQKKLEFFVDEEVADYLALLDGLSEAIRNNMKRVYAFTNSQILYDQITNKENCENPLITALKQRIMEHVENLETFVLKYVHDVNLEHPLHLAQVAVGIVHDCKDNLTTENCLICCEDKLACMTVTLKCSHKFCSHCIKAYVDEKVGLHEVPIRCPSPKCRYYISTIEHKSFLPVSSYILLDEAVLKSKNAAVMGDNFYCPFTNCSVLLDPSVNVDSTNSCVECPVCKRFICVKCGVRWHSSLSCDEFQKVSIEEINVSDVAFDCIDENRRWRRCHMCERMIETHGCYHLTCWCGHEFCYLCGAEYMNSQQTCGCSLFDVQEEDRNDQSTLTTTTPSDPTLQFEEWAWDSFGSLSNMTDAYSDQERSQLALIQRFLAGGFSLSDHHTNPCESLSTSSSNADNDDDDDDDTSYIDDTIKELHQLPWLEGFVSVISDNYYNEYTH